MKASQWFNAITLALAVTFALTLGVVCLQYAVNLDASARVREEWPTVLRTTLVFVALSGIAGAAFLAQRGGWRGRGALQALLYAALPALAGVLYRILS